MGGSGTPCNSSSDIGRGKAEGKREGGKEPPHTHKVLRTAPWGGVVEDKAPWKGQERSQQGGADWVVNSPPHWGCQPPGGAQSSPGITSDIQATKSSSPGANGRFHSITSLLSSSQTLPSPRALPPLIQEFPNPEVAALSHTRVAAACRSPLPSLQDLGQRVQPPTHTPDAQ